MNAKRLAELRNVISTEVNPRDESDLLAILSDYEAALPLLEAVRKAKVETREFYLGDESDFSFDDMQKIIELALAYNERSQPNE